MVHSALVDTVSFNIISILYIERWPSNNCVYKIMHANTHSSKMYQSLSMLSMFKYIWRNWQCNHKCNIKSHVLYQAKGDNIIRIQEHLVKLFVWTLDSIFVLAHQVLQWFCQTPQCQNRSTSLANMAAYKYASNNHTFFTIFFKMCSLHYSM